MIDPTIVLFYCYLIAGLITSNVIYGIISLASLVLIIIKDYLNKKTISKNEILQNQIDELKSDVSSLKIQGLSNLK